MGRSERTSGAAAPIASPGGEGIKGAKNTPRQWRVFADCQKTPNTGEANSFPRGEGGPRRGSEEEFGRQRRMTRNLKTYSKARFPTPEQVCYAVLAFRFLPEFLSRPGFAGPPSPRGRELRAQKRTRHCEEGAARRGNPPDLPAAQLVQPSIQGIARR